MKENRVFLTDVLTDSELGHAISLDADKIICNEVHAGVNLPALPEIINAEIYRIEGTWNAYSYNRSITESLIRKHPNGFNIKGVGLRNAICKRLYWTNMRKGALKVAYEKTEKPNILVQDQSYLKGIYAKEIFKYFKLLIQNNVRYLSKKTIVPLLSKQYQVGILVNDGFELDLYRRVISAIPAKALIVFHYGNIDQAKMALIPRDAAVYDLSHISSYAPQRVFNPFTLTLEELTAANLMYKEWQAYAQELSAYAVMRDSGIKKLLLNVAENLPERNLMPDVFEGRIKVYNTMNGMKSGEAHDADIYFDKWFVWDEHMKAMMENTCQIPSDKLLVVGHLSQDRIATYKFQNLLNIPLEMLNRKLVISIFSVRGNRKEKQAAFKILYQFLNNNSSACLIVKPHPLEKPEDYILPPPGLSNVFFVPDGLKQNKEALYDQLILTDLSIVFGSTVALESQWMGVPCITFEYKAQSFIYNAGQGEIRHVRTEQAFMALISSASKKAADKFTEFPGIAEKIATELCA